MTDQPDLTPEQLAELEAKLATYYSQLPKGEIVAGLGLKEARERLCMALINAAPQLIAMARRTAEAERLADFEGRAGQIASDNADEAVARIAEARTGGETMTKSEEIIEGLTLLADAGGNGNCDAQHDVFYADGPAPAKCGPGLLAELTRLGWHWEDDVESWAIFT